MKASDRVKHSTLLDQQPEQVRRMLPRGLRRLAAFLLLIMLAGSLVVSVAAFRPFAVTVPTPMFAYSQSITPAYSVNLAPDAPFSDRTMPAGRIYARSAVESVAVNMDISQRALWLGSLSGSSQIEAVLQVQSAQNPDALLMEKRTPLLDAEEMAPTLTASSSSRSLTVPLAPYREAADAFMKASGAAGNAILVVRLTSELSGSRFGQAISSRQSADITIPLTAESFQIAVTPAATRQLVSKQVRYLIHPELLPVFVYPAISALLLLALVLLLVLTANRPVRRFRRELRHLLRQGRRQILMIADKAWEPEWCVTVSDFGSMVQTARRLRHPIFCYVDDDADDPAAYFYVYYGENNYCYVFNGKAETRRTRLPARTAALGGPGLPAGRLPEPSDDRPLAALPHAPVLNAGRSGAGTAMDEDSRVTMAGAFAHAGPAAVKPLSGGESSNRFETGAFKPLGETPGPSVYPSAAGPLRPSNEPFLDLIRDPWPASPNNADADTDMASPLPPLTDRERSADKEAGPVPILPETDAGFSSLF